MKWIHHFKFKDLISEDNYDPEKELEQIPGLAKEAAERVRKSGLFDFYPDLAERFEKVKTEAAFNRVLDDLYNVADHNGIWVA